MIERFYNNEALEKNLDYKDLLHTLNEKVDLLMSKLEPEQKTLLFELTDIFSQLESSAAFAAFRDGFCTAALLALDIAKAKDE